MKFYKAKKNTWFKEGVICELEADCGPIGGIFSGTRIAQTPHEIKKHGIGQEYEDEELCSWDEFEIIEIKTFKEAWRDFATQISRLITIIFEPLTKIAEKLLNAIYRI